jgi:hypothetical protein
LLPSILAWANSSSINSSSTSPIYIYIHMYVYTHIRVCVCMYVYTHIFLDNPDYCIYPLFYLVIFFALKSTPYSSFLLFNVDLIFFLSLYF